MANIQISRTTSIRVLDGQPVQVQCKEGGDKQDISTDGPATVTSSMEPQHSSSSGPWLPFRAGYSHTITSGPLYSAYDIKADVPAFSVLSDTKMSDIPGKSAGTLPGYRIMGQQNESDSLMSPEVMCITLDSAISSNEYNTLAFPLSGPIARLPCSLAMLFCRNNSPCARAQRMDQIIHGVLRWTEAHLHESLTVAMLAARSGYSAGHFQRVFRERTGLSPVNYLRARKMDVAINLLLTTPLPVGMISHALGFGDTSSFNRIFKSYCGETPGRVRQERLPGPEVSASLLALYLPEEPVIPLPVRYSLPAYW